MRNKKVLVVLGGTSGEREVSLDSGRACIKALKQLGYKVSTFDPKKKKYKYVEEFFLIKIFCLCFRESILDVIVREKV